MKCEHFSNYSWQYIEFTNACSVEFEDRTADLETGYIYIYLHIYFFTNSYWYEQRSDGLRRGIWTFRLNRKNMFSSACFQTIVTWTVFWFCSVWFVCFVDFFLTASLSWNDNPWITVANFSKKKKTKTAKQNDTMQIKEKPKSDVKTYYHYTLESSFACDFRRQRWSMQRQNQELLVIFLNKAIK